MSDLIEFIGFGGSSSTTVPGCKCTWATNYNSAATVEDGSCTFAAGQDYTHPPSSGSTSLDLSSVITPMITIMMLAMMMGMMKGMMPGAEGEAADTSAGTTKSVKTTGGIFTTTAYPTTICSECGKKFVGTDKNDAWNQLVVHRKAEHPWLAEQGAK